MRPTSNFVLSSVFTMVSVSCVAEFKLQSCLLLPDIPPFTLRVKQLGGTSGKNDTAQKGRG